MCLFLYLTMIFLCMFKTNLKMLVLVFFFFFNVNDWFTFMPTLSKQKLILWPNFRLVCATVFDMNVWFILMFTICEQNRVLWLGFRLVVLLFTFLEWYWKGWDLYLLRFWALRHFAYPWLLQLVFMLFHFNFIIFFSLLISLNSHKNPKFKNQGFKGN
jgi:hypothetical protein